MKNRSHKKELLDLGPSYYSEREYKECLEKLATINKLLGIRRDSLRLIRQIKPKSILDVGCGGGQFLTHVAKLAPEISCRGIDISEEAIQFARRNTYKNLHFAKTDKLENADLIFATLVCHHMTDEELLTFVKEAYEKAGSALIIHDLERSFAFSLLFRMLAPLLFRSRLITNDGLISIERGFIRDDFKRIVREVKSDHAQISWRFPFRWEVILWKSS